ncbi:hypothetical protein QTP86_017094, partial [Hemibagrus guttatus]
LAVLLFNSATRRISKERKKKDVSMRVQLVGAAITKCFILVSVAVDPESIPGTLSMRQE